MKPNEIADALRSKCEILGMEYDDVELVMLEAANFIDGHAPRPIEDKITFETEGLNFKEMKPNEIADALRSKCEILGMEYDDVELVMLEAANFIDGHAPRPIEDKITFETEGLNFKEMPLDRVAKYLSELAKLFKNKPVYLDEITENKMIFITKKDTPNDQPK